MSDPGQAPTSKKQTVKKPTVKIIDGLTWTLVNGQWVPEENPIVPKLGSQSTSVFARRPVSPRRDFPSDE